MKDYVIVVDLQYFRYFLFHSPKKVIRGAYINSLETKIIVMLSIQSYVYDLIIITITSKDFLKIVQNSKTNASEFQENLNKCSLDTLE